MPAPVSVDLASLTGPWPVIAITGATGAGAGMNVDYALLPDLLNDGHQWALGTSTITRHTNGDWLVKSASTVLYRKVGSVAWPWSTGTWAGENSGTGTLALAKKTGTPQRSADLDDSAEYSGEAPARIASLDPPPPGVEVSGELTDGENDVVFPRLPYAGQFNGGNSYQGSHADGIAFLRYDGPGVWQLCFSSTETTDSFWNGDGEADTPADEITGWAPVSVETGTPVLAIAASTTLPPVRVEF